MNRKSFVRYRSVITMLVLIPVETLSHDTTHIHPLISSEISKLIRDIDTDGINTNNNSENAYQEIYELNSNPIAGILPTNQFRYWGTDFDQNTSITRDQGYLLSDRPALNDYTHYNSVIDGVVQEDAPSTKVLHHFYHALSGVGLTTPFSSANGDQSSVHAMAFFNKSIDWYGKYTNEAKHAAYFVFGQALHHVEDMVAPAHTHNEAENALFAPWLCYAPLKNTHVAHPTLRFLNVSRLALKQTEHFQELHV